MATVKSNEMYMMPFDSQYYALIPKRRWYAPWIWDLDCVEWLGTGGFSDFKPLASKLRYDEVLGMMKLLGAYVNQNVFIGYRGEPK